jgi:hypothetical protein
MLRAIFTLGLAGAASAFAPSAGLPGSVRRAPGWCSLLRWKSGPADCALTVLLSSTKTTAAWNSETWKDNAIRFRVISQVFTLAHMGSQLCGI